MAAYSLGLSFIETVILDESWFTYNMYILFRRHILL